MLLRPKLAISGLAIYLTATNGQIHTRTRRSPGDAQCDASEIDDFYNSDTVHVECDAGTTHGQGCQLRCIEAGTNINGPPGFRCVCSNSEGTEGPCAWKAGSAVMSHLFSSSGNQVTCQSWWRSFSADTPAPTKKPKVLVGDDEIDLEVSEVEQDVELSLQVQGAENICAAFDDPGHGGTWSCTDSNNESSSCNLSCPEGYKVSSESAASQNCVCSTEYDGPIIIDGGCNWDGDQPGATCVVDEDYQETCVPLTAPINGTMSCSDGFNEGTRCDFQCDAHPHELIFPAKSGRRRCKCRKNKGCFWSRQENSCGPFPIAPECSALPEMTNRFTELVCDDENAHASRCTFVCAPNFRLNMRGHHSMCTCYRKRGEYKCSWKRQLEGRWCVPAPRYYRKWHRAYSKATSRNDKVLMEEMETEYAEINSWAHDTLSEAFKKRKRRSINRRRAFDIRRSKIE